MHKKLKKHTISPAVIYSAIIAALGAFLFGYQTAIISGAGPFIAKDFALTTFQLEMVVSTILIGCFVGALCAGLSDVLGRKYTLFLTTLIYLMATFCLLDATSFAVILVGRFLAGLAVGLASIIVPLYIAEISPPDRRGQLVSLNQLMVTIGILASYFVAYFYASTGNWRSMFEMAFIPAALQFIGLFFVPETPHWLISKGKIQAAERALHRLRMADPRSHLVHEEQKADKPLKKTMRGLFAPGVRKPFVIGIAISLIQQLTGINTVLYYSAHIFQLAGFGSVESALSASIWIGVVLVVMTVVAMYLVDRIGRRSLFLIGLTGMAFFLIVLGYGFLFHVKYIGAMSLISLVGYTAFFSASLGPVAWVILSEIYPLGVRGRAMSIAGSANWVGNFCVSLTFLTLIQLLSIGGVYWLYAVICALGFYFVWKEVPETKGKTFEEIQRFWQK